MRTIEAPQGKLDGTYVVRGIRGERVVVVVGDCSLDRIANTPRRYAVVHVDDCDEAAVVVVGKVDATFARPKTGEKAGNGIRVSKCKKARVAFVDGDLRINGPATDDPLDHTFSTYAVECLDCDSASIVDPSIWCYGTTVRAAQLTRCGMLSSIRNLCVMDEWEGGPLPGRKVASIVGGRWCSIFGAYVETPRGDDWAHRACGYRDSETGRMVWCFEPHMDDATDCRRQVQNAILKDGRPSWADNWTREIAATCPKALPPETE